ILVAVAGTATTVAAHALSIAPYDGARVHGANLSRDQVAAARANLAAMTLSARRELATVSPARADVIVAGPILLEEAMDAMHARELTISDRGVRWGLAAELAA